jgi:hypothetical protein
MAKILVDTQTNEIRGYFKEPVDFSISGRYILDVPNGTYPATNVVADIIASKIYGICILHPLLPNYFNDELLATPNVDPSISSGFILGPNKRTEVLPSGYVYTNPLTLVMSPTTALIHVYGFTIYSDPGAVVSHPAPNRLLYNYDPLTSSFFEFDPITVFQVDIVHSVTLAPSYSFLNYNAEEFITLPSSAPLIRLKFTNIGTTRYHLSDWMFMYG